MHSSPKCDVSTTLPPSGWVEDLGLFRSITSNVPSLLTNSSQFPTRNTSPTNNENFDTGKPTKKIKTNGSNIVDNVQSKKKFRFSKDSLIEQHVIQIDDSDDEKNSYKRKNVFEPRDGVDVDSLVMKDPVVSHLKSEIVPEKEMSKELKILELKQVEYLLEMRRLSILSTIMSEKKVKLQNKGQGENGQSDFSINLSENLSSYQTTNSTASSDSSPKKYKEDRSHSQKSIIVLDSEDEDSKTDSLKKSFPVKNNGQNIKSGLLNSSSLNDALQNLRSETEIGIKFQVCVPDFSLNNKTTTKLKRQPQLIWTPELIERDNLERIMQDLSKIVRKNVSNQEAVLKILKSFQMDDAQMLSTIRRKKGSYRNFFDSTPRIGK